MKLINPSAFLAVYFALLFSNVVSLEAEHMYNGSDLDIQSVPYFVFLLVNGQHTCGGTLIAPNIVLLAAHCIFDERSRTFIIHPYEVKAGASNAHSPGITSAVTKIYCHKKYRRMNGHYYNDIALLRLAKPFDVYSSPFIGLAKLPPRGEKYSDGTVIVAGAGMDRVQEFIDPMTGAIEMKQSSTGKLKFATITIKNDRSDCLAQTFPNVFCGEVKKRSRSTPNGLCRGDSGSPVINKNRVIGIVSAGSKECDDTILPSIFTKVANYIDFINGVINDRPTSDTLVQPLGYEQRTYEESIYKQSSENQPMYKTIYVPYWNVEATIISDGFTSSNQMQQSREFEKLVNKLTYLKDKFDTNSGEIRDSSVSSDELYEEVMTLLNEGKYDSTEYREKYNEYITKMSERDYRTSVTPRKDTLLYEINKLINRIKSLWQSIVVDWKYYQ